MRQSIRLLWALFALLTVTASFAAPADWHWWQSKLDGRLFCSQTSPGSGWEKQKRPYRDLNCKQPTRTSHLKQGAEVEPGQPDVMLPGNTPVQQLD